MLGLEPQTIKAFGQVAGIGGLSLFVFVYLFREVIRKKIFPQLTSDHAYRLIRLFLILVFAFSTSGLAAWVFGPSKNIIDETYKIPSEDSYPIILSWMKKIDDKNYVDAYNIGDDLMIKQNFTLARFIDLTKTARDSLGEPIERINYKSGILLSPQGAPKGYYSYSLFRTKFSNGAMLYENVYLRASDGRWKPCSYEIFPIPGKT